MENAKFCSNCGKLVPSEEEQSISPSVSENISDTRIPDTVDIKASISPYIVKLCGRDLKFDYRFEEYNTLRRRYFDHGNTLTQEFASYYEENVHDFDTLYDKGLEFFIAKAKNFLEFSVSIAHEYGSHNIDMEWYLQFSDEAVGFCSVMNYYRDISVQLIDLAETMASYRAAKSSRRSYWQGGGFGIAGAIRGALTASALNLGSDIMHSIGNTIGSSSDRARLRKVEQDIYQERDHCKYLTRALESWFEAMWRATENVLKQHNLVPDFDSGSALMPILEADDIVRNASANTPDSEYDRAIDLIFQGLPHDPYCPIMAYTALYQIPQTDKKEIQELVQLLGIEKEYNIKKYELVQNLIAPILEMPESTVPQIDEKLCAFEDFHIKFPDYSVSAYTKQLDKKKNNTLQPEAEAKTADEEQELAEIIIKIEQLSVLPISERTEAEKARLWIRKNELEWQATFPDTYDVQIKELHKSQKYVSQLINDNKIEEIWDLTNKGCVYAEFRLYVLYHSRLISIFKKQDIDQYKTSILDIQKYATKGSIFAEALCTLFDYLMFYFYNANRTRKQTPEFVERMHSLANRGSIFATYYMGYWGVHTYFGLSQSQGKEWIDIAAAKLYPEALWLLGEAYSEGKYGYPINKPRAYYFYKLYFACFESPNCDKINQLLNTYKKTTDSPTSTQSSKKVTNSPKTSTQSSGCFITSAVCRTLGKPDDCYELTAFRSFRDNWLCGQPDGQTLIQEYYQVAPAIVAQIDKRSDSKEIYQSIWETHLLPCLCNIESQQFIQCKNTYISMIKQLKDWFC